MFSRIIAVVCMAVLCCSSHGASTTVTNNSDSGAGSLRDAIANASAGDTINFSASGLTGGQTITLASALSPAVDLTITGDSAPAVSIISSTTRVFDFTTATLAAVTLDQLTINGAPSDTNIGGAIRLAVATAGSFTLTITKCNITGASNNSGGAIGFNTANNNISISDSTISGANNSTSANQNLTRGGALYFSGGVNTVATSTITGTCHGSGGGFAAQGGTTTFTNCTIANSSATNAGGGVHGLSGTLNMIACTVTGNSAPSGGGIAQATAIINLTNCIVANNTNADSSGTLANATNCLFKNLAGTAITTSTNNITGTDPDLGTLQNNGGLTTTIALLPASTPGLNPAFGKGTASGTPTTDQRGLPRANPPAIGAFEPQKPTVTRAAMTAVANTLLSSVNVGNFVSFGAADSTYSATIDWGDGSPVSAATVTPGSAAAVQGTVNGTLTGSHTYGSTGVFTVTATMTDPNGLSGNGTFSVTVISPPAASLTSAPDVDNSSNANSYSFSVQYSSDAAIDVSTLDGSDILVTGPNGFSQSAAFSNVAPAGNGSPRTATYTITPPNGAWSPDASGTYTLALQAGSVGATIGGSVAAKTLGTFSVGILSFISAATATPNTAGVGQVVTFTAAANLSDSSIAWDFGDGSSGTGTSATHAYASAGTYTAIATASLNALTLASSVSVSVKAPVVGEGNDSDGDGFSDVFESTLKTDPNDSTSAPFTLGASPAIQTVNGKFSAKLNFAAPNLDAMTLSGTFPVAANVQVASSTAGIALGSFTAAFSFDSKSKAISTVATRKLTLKIKKRKNGATSTATVSLKVKKENLQLALAPFGLTNATVKSAPVTVNAMVVFGGALNQVQVSEHYTATAKLGKTVK